MAVFRPPNYCPFCCELIREIHDKQEGIPPMMQRIGDNFLRYEDHVCKEGKRLFEPPTEEQSEEVKKWYDALNG